MNIGIAEDDPDQLALISGWLEGVQHSVRGFGTAAAFFDALKKEHFDLLLIDWTLPDGTGADLLPWIRGNLGWDVPVLVVTARDDEATVVQALQAGADDYVVKRIPRFELLARVAGLGRRVRSGGLPVLRLGAFAIDINRQRLTLDDEPVALAQKNLTCLCTCSRTRASSCRVTICSTKYGASAQTWTPAPWTPTSAACAKS